MMRRLLAQFVTLAALWIPAVQAAAGSFTVSPAIAELGAGITVTYQLEDYTPRLFDIIAIYASGEVRDQERAMLFLVYVCTCVCIV